ncbi:MAG: SDR family NAD(P)-dependent oxidoreductase [Thermomicrobiales bacterium]
MPSPRQTSASLPPLRDRLNALPGWLRHPGVAAGLGAGVTFAAAREGIARLREEDLTGQVALITGGSRGLGLAIARELASAGCRIAICARDMDELDRAARELEPTHPETLALICDVGDEAAVEAMVRQVLDRFGQVDILVTAAGIIEVADVRTLGADDFRTAMDTMFWGTLYPILAVLPGMRERQHGHIVTITSIGGKIAVPHLLAYTSAKFATVGLSEGLSAELARDGIAVTTVVPGLMRTGSHLNATFRGDRKGQKGEYAWFSLGATSPLVPRADRAARIIVRGIRRRSPEVVYTFPFALADRMHGVAPALTVRAMRLANRFLPDSGSTPPSALLTSRGSVIEARMDGALHEVPRALGEEAADAFNERPGPAPSPAAP